MKDLNEGDVIHLKKGHKVYTSLPEKFIFSNRKFSEKLRENDVKVGEIYKAPTEAEEDIKKICTNVSQAFSYNGITLTWEEIIDMVLPKIPKLEPDSFEFEEGLFIVLKTSVEGGGQGHGRHDYYPDGKRVYVKRLKEDSTFDPDGQEANFYISGSFTATNTDIEVIGKKQKIYK